MWVTQKTLEERFPLNEFLMKPKILNYTEEAKKMGITPTYQSVDTERADLKFPDREFEYLAKYFAEDDRQGNQLKSTPHPEFPERNYIKDIETMMGKYRKEREKRGYSDTMNMNDINRMYSQLNKEYADPQPDWYEGLLRGKFVAPGFGEPSAKQDKEEEENEAKDAKFQTSYEGKKRKKWDDDQESNTAKDKQSKEPAEKFPLDPKQ